MEIKESNFAGFLDGYQSRNIEYIENNFHYKITDINDILLWLLAELKKNPTQNNDLQASLGKIGSLRTERNYHKLMEQLYKLGEFLILNLKTLNKYADLEDKGIHSKIKILVYNFVELAKLSEDAKLINLAIEIGARFKY